MQNSVSEQIKGLIAEDLEVETNSINENAPLDEQFGFNSMDMIDLCYRIDTIFDIDDTFEALKLINPPPKTISAIVPVVEELVKRKSISHPKLGAAKLVEL